MSGGTPATSNPEYWDGTINWYTPAEISEARYVYGSQKKITEVGLNNSSAKILPKDRTILFTSRAGIGKTAILKNDASTNQGFQSIVVKNNIDPEFVYSMSTQIKEKAERVAAGSTFSEISGKQLGKIILMIPGIKEQQRIGELFSIIDNLITLHQRKSVTIKKLKSGLLRKMILTVESTLTDVFLPLFTIDWEQRKLGEMASFAKGNGYTKADLSTEGKPIILYGRLYTDYETVFSSIDTRSGQKPGSLLSKGGEVVVPASGETADEIARASVVMPDGIILGGDLNVITPNQAINPVFLAIELSSGNLHKVLASKAQGKSVVHLHNSDLQTLDVVFPSLDEQSQIGLCFEEFDALITLHQRKLDDLKKLKSGLLQKMFPKAGETVPEVRFPEFTGDWEQRKFKDLVFKSGKKNKKNLPYESFSITNESGFVSQNERFENGGTMKDADKSMYIIVSPNSFAYNPARINVGSIGYQALGKNVIVSSLYEVFKTSHEVDDHFLWYWFKSDHFKRLVESLQEGGVRLYFYFDKLQKGELWLPPIEEQRKIGGYFKSVDNLITLHQRKLFIIAYIK